MSGDESPRGKRPAFQHYPGDEERETALKLAGLAAFGLWRRMINLMHEGSPYGHLTLADGRAISDGQLAALVGDTPTIVKRLLRALEDANVFSRTEKGVVYCRRMVRDEHLREVRVASGKLGGNPNLIAKRNNNHTVIGSVKQTDKEKQTPSSSSSVSSVREDPRSGVDKRGKPPGAGVSTSTPREHGRNGNHRNGDHAVPLAVVLGRAFDVAGGDA